MGCCTPIYFGEYLDLGKAVLIGSLTDGGLVQPGTALSQEDSLDDLNRFCAVKHALEAKRYEFGHKPHPHTGDMCRILV